MTALLEAIEISKRFPVKRPARGIVRALMGGARSDPAATSWLHAVDNVSFTIGAGESVGLVGESGCGKSTLVRILARLADPSEGNILFDGQSLALTPAHRFSGAPARSRIQMVFQDAGESLNPRFTAFDAIAEPLRVLAGMRETAAIGERVNELARLTGLPNELLTRYPHQLSGGQKARVGIARAIAVNPSLLVLDEPTSALDVSVQALILKLLADLRRELDMSYLFVSHDLNVVRLICDRVLVMYLGRIVESGPAREIFDAPQHPYTKALVSAVPRIDGAASLRIHLDGEPRSPIDPAPNVCRLYGRCREQQPRCATEAPLLRPVADGRAVACHFPAAAA